jgi:hypothetical protein
MREMGLAKNMEKFPPEILSDRRRLSSKSGPNI